MVGIPTLTGMPDEVLADITGHLALTDLKIARKVCRRLSRASFKHFATLSIGNLNLTGIEQTTSPMLTHLSTYTDILKYTTHLGLFAFHGDPSSSVDRTPCRRFFPLDSRHIHLLALLPSLTVLELSHIDLHLECTELVAALDSCNARLKTLSVKVCKVSSEFFQSLCRTQHSIALATFHNTWATGCSIEGGGWVAALTAIGQSQLQRLHFDQLVEDCDLACPNEHHPHVSAFMPQGRKESPRVVKCVRAPGGKIHCYAIGRQEHEEEYPWMSWLDGTAAVKAGIKFILGHYLNKQELETLEF